MERWRNGALWLRNQTATMLIGGTHLDCTRQAFPRLIEVALYVGWDRPPTGARNWARSVHRHRRVFQTHERGTASPRL